MSRFVQLSAILDNTVKERDEWGILANTPDAMSHVTAVYKDGKIYRCSGSGNLLEYNLVTKTYTSKNTPGSGVSGMCAIAESGGKIYFFGGYTSTPLNAYKYFDINTSVWSATYSMPFARMQFAASTAANGKIYLFGGMQTASTATNAIYEFDPASAVFAQKTNLPAATRFMCASTVGNYIYIAGGQAGTSGAINSFYRYNTMTDSLETLAVIPIAVRGASLAVVGMKLYLTGGFNASGAAIDSNYEYDVAKAAWSKKTSLTMARGDHASCGVSSERSVHILNGYGSSSTNLDKHEIYLI